MGLWHNNIFKCSKSLWRASHFSDISLNIKNSTRSLDIRTLTLSFSLTLSAVALRDIWNPLTLCCQRDLVNIRNVKWMAELT